MTLANIRTKTATVLVNLDRLIMVDEISEGHCRLNFGGNEVCELNGEGVGQFIKDLRKTVVVDIQTPIELTFLESTLPPPVDAFPAGTPRLP